MSRFPELLLAAVLAATPALPEGLGRLALPEEVAAWDIDVRPDGLGLPDGSGTVAEGEVLYTEKCAQCHGDFGEAVGRWPELAGGFGTLDGEDPVKTIGSYWPFLTTVWDYVHRAMPYGEAQSLSAGETYALVAYLLFLNDLELDETFELNRENFTEISLPNEARFVADDRDTAEIAIFSTDPCMTGCKDKAVVTARVQTPGLTPTVPEIAVEAALVVAVADPDLVATGAKLFKKCKSCHQIGEGAKNRSGPVLTGVVGRGAASVDGFRYSKAMLSASEAGLVWTEENLAEFLTRPKAFIPKTRMSFGGFKEAADRAAIIAYLQSIPEQ